MNNFRSRVTFSKHPDPNAAFSYFVDDTQRGIICALFNTDDPVIKDEQVSYCNTIKEAFDTLHETGKTPKQLADALSFVTLIKDSLISKYSDLITEKNKLAESNAELLEALKCAYNVCKSTYPLFNEWVENKVISEAINKASLTK